MPGQSGGGGNEEEVGGSGVEVGGSRARAWPGRVKSEGHELDKSSNKSLLGIKFFALLYLPATHHLPPVFPLGSLWQIFSCLNCLSGEFSKFLLCLTSAKDNDSRLRGGKEVRQEMVVASPRFSDFSID